MIEQRQRLNYIPGYTGKIIPISSESSICGKSAGAIQQSFQSNNQKNEFYLDPGYRFLSSNKVQYKNPSNFSKVGQSLLSHQNSEIEQKKIVGYQGYIPKDKRKEVIDSSPINKSYDAIINKGHILGYKGHIPSSKMPEINKITGYYTKKYI